MHVQVYAISFILGRSTVTSVIRFWLYCLYDFYKLTVSKIIKSTQLDCDMNRLLVKKPENHTRR